MFDTCVDDTLQHLSVVEKHPRIISYDLPRYENMKMYQAELRLYRMLLWCIPDAAADADLLADLNFIAASIAQLYKLDPETDSLALPSTEYDSLRLKVDDMRRNCGAQINKLHYLHHLVSSFSSPPPSCCFTSNNDTTIEFLDSVHAVLIDFFKYTDKTSKPNSLVESVLLLRDLVYYTNPRTKLIFGFDVHHWANKAACFSLLLWLLRSNIDSFLIDLLLHQGVNPCNPDFINFCFQVIKVPKMKHADKDRLLFGEFVSRFVDFFLENLVFVLNDNDNNVQMVQEGLIFVLTFLADPPANTMIHSQLIMPLVRERIYSVLDRASYIMCFFREANIDLSRGNTILDDFLKSIHEVRGDIVNLYVHIPPLSWSTFPRINKLGSFECLLAYLENLKDTMSNNRKLVPFLKHQFFTIHEELLPLRLFLRDTWMTQNEHSESKDIWEQIMSLLCQADCAIKSSFFTDNAIWYNLTRLSFLVRMIKDIRNKVMNIQFETQIEGRHISISEAIQPLMSSIDVPKPPTSTSNVEAVVGFEKETDLLIDRLVYGSAQLDIVPIVGMGGIGKTTIAIKLYNEVAVKNHFYKRAFCSVSQVYRKRNVLLGILSDFSPNDDRIRQMSVDDLAQRLRQSLLGFRYLIVLDDIWDISVWDDLKASFPNDCNGSRIIFTTRISNLSKSTPCPLPFLTIDESWELLRLKVFHKDPCPPHLLELGKMIAKNCKGLPLSIVVIAGLLTRTKRSLLSWKEVADTLSSFASSEGCNEIIKLSYKQLPDALKSCFLYLGAFPEDEILVARHLALLWVAEGFVLKSEGGSLLDIAKNYLNDLSDRNLVAVTQRSYDGAIKSCRVHDLIRDFCRTEAQEENHLCYINAHNKDFPMSRVLHQHRISIEEDEWRSFVNAKPRGSSVHSLLFLSGSLPTSSEAHCEVNYLQAFLSNFKLVQVLDLLKIVIDGEFPTTVTMLVHLRYLALRFSNNIYVPPDIINLWNLETLTLLACEYSGMLLSLDGNLTETSEALETTYVKENLYEVAIPKDIWKMKRLRDVEVTAYSFVALDDVTGLISPLPDLISFGYVFIPYGEVGDELLRRLSNVRKFSCHCSGFWDPDRECNELPKLETLTTLESLCMVFTGEARPKPYMFSLPPTIRELILEEFSAIPWNEFSAIIGMLPCLEVLVLKNSFSGKRWNLEEDERFPSIKYLTLNNLDIEEWNASVDSFPSLVKLFVLTCLKHIAIPPCFGEVETLMSITVDGCKESVADAAIEILKDQFDYGNESFEVDLFDIQI